LDKLEVSAISDLIGTDTLPFDTGIDCLVVIFNPISLGMFVELDCLVIIFNPVSLGIF
jgi:hypothetical protein